MDLSLILNNLLTPPILFFFLGMAATLAKSDLDLPQSVTKFLSLYLLFAIGFHGGVELNKSGINAEVGLALGAAILMAVVVPLYTFPILRLRLGTANAAAMAATYGSVSAVTFITAASFLSQVGTSYGGHMVAAMALMESPAIVIGVVLVRMLGAREEPGVSRAGWSHMLRDSFLNSAVFLLLGSLLIGLITGESGWQDLEPLTGTLFKGVLALFLLDMGIVAARRLGDLRRSGLFLTCFAVVIPLVNAGAGIALAYLIGMGRGDALMFSVLCASASYIAVPAAVRIAIPQANPSIYVPAALALTFPFNIIIGIPLYMAVIDRFWS